jgi:subtilisin family serine protease
MSTNKNKSNSGLSRRDALKISGLIGGLALAPGRQLGAQEPAAKGATSAPVTIQGARGLAMPQSNAKMLQTGANSLDERSSPDERSRASESQVREFQAVSVAFDSAENCQKCPFQGATLITRRDKYALMFLPQNYNLDQLKAWPGFVWSEVEFTNIFPPPPRPEPSKERSRAVPEKIVQGGVGNITGKGVIVAIVDSGVDFQHPDFVTKDAQGRPVSRFLYFWDLTSDAFATGVGSKADYAYPNGASIGTVYDQATLTASLRGEKYIIREWDTNSHGTVCAGVAAGNGSGLAKYKGVAPDADLIAVRISDGNNSDPSNRCAYMLPAICEWLDKKASEHKKPLVVSCSFGGMYGRHDGHNIDELYLNSLFSLDKVGRGICVAAGNSGYWAVHASVPVGPKEAAPTVEWEINSVGFLQIYLQTDKADDIGFEALEGTKIISKEDDYIHPLTKHIVLVLKVEPGRGGFRMYSKSGAKYEGDAYLNGGIDWARGLGFKGETQSFGKQIATPASAQNVLAIGSYDWNDQFPAMGGTLTLFGRDEPMKIGGISYYSNQGPLRFGNITKPEVVAPGQWYCASAPRNVVPRLRENSGLYMEHNGTSAATPYAAGVVALMFQKKPNLTWGDARKVITESASSNVTTGKTPNPTWGYGKLDYAAVEKILDRLK